MANNKTGQLRLTVVDVGRVDAVLFPYKNNGRLNPRGQRVTVAPWAQLLEALHLPTDVEVVVRAADFIVQDEGTLVLLHPQTDAAREWVFQHLPSDAQRFGEAVVIEPRYVDDILFGIHNDGLVAA